MEGALAWIGQLAQWFGQFFPRWIILNTTEGAVKFVRGKNPVELKPGIHWYWPAMTEVKSWVCARQSLNMQTQTLTTTDGKTIAVGGLLIYRIVDILTIVAHTWNPDATIRDIAAGVIHDICSRHTWQELQDQKNNGELYLQLRREMRKRMRPFGVRVLGATLTDFSLCRVLKLINTSGD